MKKIHYTITEQSENVSGVSPDSSLCLNELSHNLDPVINFIDEKYIYTKCPVWSHKAKRTYVMRCPFDFEFRMSTNGADPVISPRDDFVYFDPGWDNLNPVLQLCMPVLFAWTKEKNIWIDIQPTPYTALKNNFVVIGGQWNLSRWTRPISFGIQVVDSNRNVKVKRGDAIYYVSFRSDDPNEIFSLIRENHIPEDILRESSQRTGLKKFIPGLSTKYLFERQNSKCPFKFIRR